MLKLVLFAAVLVCFAVCVVLTQRELVDDDETVQPEGDQAAPRS